MPLIHIQLEGHKQFGGYLTVDSGKTHPRVFSEELYDQKIIEIGQGFHEISFNNMSHSELYNNKLRRENYNSPFFDDAWKDYGAMVSCSTNHEFEYFEVMSITIKSDINGRIIETPKFQIKQVTKEQYDSLLEMKKKMDYIVKENKEKAAKEAAKTKTKYIIFKTVFILLLILGILTLFKSIALGVFLIICSIIAKIISGEYE